MILSTINQSINQSYWILISLLQLICSSQTWRYDESSGGDEAELNSLLEHHGSDGEEGAEGHSLGEDHSDSVHHQQEEVQPGFFWMNVLAEIQVVIVGGMVVVGGRVIVAG